MAGVATVKPGAANFDTSRLFRRLKHIDAARPAARAVAAREMAGHIIRYIDQHGKRDTNRYVRGWIMAGNDAGVSRIPVPVVKKSGRHDKFVEALMEQALFWKDLEERLQTAYSRLYGYRTTPGKRKRSSSMPPGQRELLKRLGTATRNRERAFQELERVVEHADRVVMVGLYSTVDKGFASGKGRSLTRTTRHKVYGGTGRVYDTTHETWIVFHNREPHTTLVETKNKTYAKARAAVGGLGMRQASAAYLRTVKQLARAA